MVLHKNTFNQILLRLEEDGFITLGEKAKELIKKLSEMKYLHTLKLLFDNPCNKFSPKVLQDSLVALVNQESFDYIQNLARLELHLRTLAAVLEQICFTQMHLGKELRDRVYDSLTKFSEIHRKTIQVAQKRIDNKYTPDINRFSQLKVNKEDEDITRKRNYNIDFLLIHLRDSLYSLYGDETWFQEVVRRTNESLEKALNTVPGVVSATTGVPMKSDSILSMLAQLRQGLSFKYSIASYYIDWRIMLIIQRNIFMWSENSEKIINKKFGELVLMEYIWSFLEREWINAANKSILESQIKFDKVAAKTLKNTNNLTNDLSGNESLTLSHTLWFGLLDLAQNLIQKSTRKSTYGLCYYLAIESLNKSPNSSIQFKAIEILLHLHNIDKQMFSIIEIDFDQYSQKLSGSNLSINSSEKFQSLLTFVRGKCFEDFKILNDNTGKGKGKGKSLTNQNTYLKREQVSKSYNIIDIIADEMTCSISNELTNQLCVLKCQHVLSLNNLKKLKPKTCPKCREKIEDNDIRYVLQNSIYENLYSKFFEAGYISPSNELKDSDQKMNNQYDSGTDNPPVLTKKKKIFNVIKLKSIISSSISPRISKKQHQMHQNVIKEINGKNYTKAEYLCKEFLKAFSKSYSTRCILAYIYRCLDNYEKAHFYLDEAIGLKEKTPIAYFIRGEIFFRQNEYEKSIKYLNKSLNYKAKIDNLHIIFGNSYLFTERYELASHHYNIALKNGSSYYLCLKNCAYSYEKQEDYSNTLQMLDKLLSINRKDSLILCYYGEILSNMGFYNDSILHFTKANIIDPENVHILNKRAIAYYFLREYNKVLLDLDKVVQLDPLNSLAHYHRSLTYYTKKDINSAIAASKKCIGLLLNSDSILAKIQLYHLKYLLNKHSSEDLNYDIIANINQILSVNDDKSLLLIRCKTYVESKKYHEAKLDLDKLFELNREDNSFIHSLQEYSGFWSYLCEVCKINNNGCTEVGIVNEFNKYMYKEKKVYFVSTLINLNSNFCQFQENNSNSLSGQVLSFKDRIFNLSLPKFYNLFEFTSFYTNYYIIWKINIKKIISADCFVKFTVEQGEFSNEVSYKEHVLKYKDISKFEGLGWIEYTLPIYIWKLQRIQLSIKVNGPIDMQIDYVRFSQINVGTKPTCISNMGYLLPSYYKIYPNVPETFKEEYFSRKEMENLLELKDII